MGREPFRGRGRALRPGAATLRTRPCRGARRRARPRWARQAAGPRLWPRHGHPPARCAVRIGRGARPRRGDAPRSPEAGGRTRRVERALGQRARRDASSGPRQLSRGHARGVVPLDGPSAGGGGRSVHARSGRRRRSGGRPGLPSVSDRRPAPLGGASAGGDRRFGSRIPRARPPCRPGHSQHLARR